MVCSLVPVQTDCVFGRRHKTVGEAVDEAVRFGWPGMCPACGAAGRLEHIDVVNRRSTSSCPSCHTSWTMLEQLDGSVAPIPTPSRPVPQGPG